MANPKKTAAHRRRKKNRGWLIKLLLFVSIPLIVWFAAFLMWFYWSSLSALFTGAKKQEAKPVTKGSSPVQPSKNAENPPAKQPQERILEQDRKKLDDILKRQD